MEDVYRNIKYKLTSLTFIEIKMFSRNLSMNYYVKTVFYDQVIIINILYPVRCHYGVIWKVRKAANGNLGLFSRV